jgi:hypothetical protein
MWTRQINPKAKFQATTDELAVSITDDVIGVVALMVAPLAGIVIDHPQDGVTSLIFLTETNQAVSISIQGGVELLEAALAAASYDYHHREDSDA